MRNPWSPHDDPISHDARPGARHQSDPLSLENQAPRGSGALLASSELDENASTQNTSAFTYNQARRTTAFASSQSRPHYPFQSSLAQRTRQSEQLNGWNRTGSDNTHKPRLPGCGSKKSPTNPRISQGNGRHSESSRAGEPGQNVVLNGQHRLSQDRKSKHSGQTTPASLENGSSSQGASSIPQHNSFGAGNFASSQWPTQAGAQAFDDSRVFPNPLLRANSHAESSYKPHVQTTSTLSDAFNNMTLGSANLNRRFRKPGFNDKVFPNHANTLPARGARRNDQVPPPMPNMSNNHWQSRVNNLSQTDPSHSVPPWVSTLFSQTPQLDDYTFGQQNDGLWPTIRPIGNSPFANEFFPHPNTGQSSTRSLIRDGVTHGTLYDPSPHTSEFGFHAQHPQNMWQEDPRHSQHADSAQNFPFEVDRTGFAPPPMPSNRAATLGSYNKASQQSSSETSREASQSCEHPLLREYKKSSKGTLDWELRVSHWRHFLLMHLLNSFPPGHLRPCRSIFGRPRRFEVHPTKA